MAIVRNREKLKTLVHYVVARCDDPSLLGSIKLNKVLWVSDLWAYVGTGAPITGERYIKQQFGPVPASMVGILDELQSEKKLVVRRTAAHGNPKTDYIALTRPDNISQTFSADEISLVDEAIEFVCEQHTAMQISDRSHDVIWELAEIGEEIPYHAMLASRLDGVTKEDVAWARNAHDAALIK
jgi:hypothetical protein